jgi:hypothetical protein
MAESPQNSHHGAALAVRHIVEAIMPPLIAKAGLKPEQQKILQQALLGEITIEAFLASGIPDDRLAIIRPVIDTLVGEMHFRTTNMCKLLAHFPK